MNNDPLVKVRHLKDQGMCARGIRQWFAMRGMDYNHFLREGIPASEVEATGDALGIAVAKVAREEAAEGEH